MKKAEYIQVMEKALVGNVSPQELSDIISYYRDYIDMEIQKGKTEQEVLDMLGNPRHLVKSIIAAKEQKGAQMETETAQDERSSGQRKGFRIPLFLLIIIVVLLLWLVLGFVAVVARFLLPVLLPVILVTGIVRFAKRLKK